MENKFVYENIDDGIINFVDKNKVIKQFKTYGETKRYLIGIGFYVSFKTPYKSKNNKNFYIIEKYINQKDEDDDNFNQNELV